MRGIAALGERARLEGRTAKESQDRSGPAVAVRMSFRMKSQLIRLAQIGDRPTSWMFVQALRRLFREIEIGILLHDDIRRHARHLDRGEHSFHFTLPSTAYEALGRLAETTGKDMSSLVRLAVGRYLAVRLSLLRGDAEYQDSLLESPPILPT